MATKFKKESAGEKVIDLKERHEVTVTKDHPLIAKGIVKEGQVIEVGTVLKDMFLEKGFVK